MSADPSTSAGLSVPVARRPGRAISGRSPPGWAHSPVSVSKAASLTPPPASASASVQAAGASTQPSAAVSGAAVASAAAAQQASQPLGTWLRAPTPDPMRRAAVDRGAPRDRGHHDRAAGAPRQGAGSDRDDAGTSVGDDDDDDDDDGGLAEPDDEANPSGSSLAEPPSFRHVWSLPELVTPASAAYLSEAVPLEAPHLQPPSPPAADEEEPSPEADASGTVDPSTHFTLCFTAGTGGRPRAVPLSVEDFAAAVAEPS